VSVVPSCPAVTLAGQLIVLEPLTLAAVPELLAAAREDRSSYQFTHVPAEAGDMTAYVAMAIAEQQQGRGLPFTIRERGTGRVVGSTRFLHLSYWNSTPPWQRAEHLAAGTTPDAADIGYTWLAATAQRSGVNTEAKYLMLAYAFEEWRASRISLKADVRNLRSRRAIESLGAHLEGVRRAEYLSGDGLVRDTAYYSVLAAEWPPLRDRLLNRLVRVCPLQPA